MSEQTFLIEFFKLEHAEKAVVGATEGCVKQPENFVYYIAQRIGPCHERVI